MEDGTVEVDKKIDKSGKRIDTILFSSNDTAGNNILAVIEGFAATPASFTAADINSRAPSFALLPLAFHGTADRDMMTARRHHRHFHRRFRRRRNGHGRRNQGIHGWQGPDQA